MENQSGQPVDPAAFLEANLRVVEAVVADVARRHRVRGDAVDEFRSLAFLKLIEQDYAVLKRFQGASSLKTYLTVVLQRVLLDQRNREWGRWRASAAATRLGPVAIQLERLVTRDGLTPGEAMAALGAHADVSGCAEFVSALGMMRARASRMLLGEEAIPDRLDPAPGPDAEFECRERAAQAAAVHDLVAAALRSLPSADRLLVTLRYRDGLSIADAARVLGVDAKPLYRRLERILGTLRAQLRTDELQGDLARELAHEPVWDAAATGESGWWRQSNRVNGPSAVTAVPARGGLSRRAPARRVHRRVRPGAVAGNRAASL